MNTIKEVAVKIKTVALKVNIKIIDIIQEIVGEIKMLEEIPEAYFRTVEVEVSVVRFLIPLTSMMIQLMYSR